MMTHLNFLENLMFWRKYRYVDWDRFSTACFLTGCFLATISWRIETSGVFAFIFLFLGAAGSLISFMVKRKVIEDKAETLPLLSPSQFTDGNYQTDKRDVLKYKPLHTKELLDDDGEDIANSGASNDTNFTNETSQSACVSIDNSRSKKSPEFISNDIVKCIEFNPNRYVVPCYEQYASRPVPGGVFSRKASEDAPEIPKHITTPLRASIRRPVAQTQTAQFYVPLSGTTPSTVEETRSSDNASLKKSSSFSSSNKIFEDLISSQTHPHSSSAHNDSQTKPAFTEEKETEASRISKTQESGFAPVQQVSKADYKREYVPRVGDFTSTNIIYANIFPSEEEQVPKASTGTHINRTNIAPADYKIETNIHKSYQSRADTVQKLSPENTYVNVLPAKSRENEANIPCTSYGGSSPKTGKISINKEISTPFEIWKNLTNEETARKILLKADGNNIKVSSDSPLKYESPYMNVPLLQEPTRKLHELHNSSLDDLSITKNQSRMSEIGESIKSERIYMNLPFVNAQQQALRNKSAVSKNLNQPFQCTSSSEHSEESTEMSHNENTDITPGTRIKHSGRNLHGSQMTQDIQEQRLQDDTNRIGWSVGTNRKPSFGENSEKCTVGTLSKDTTENRSEYANITCVNPNSKRWPGQHDQSFSHSCPDNFTSFDNPIDLRGITCLSVKKCHSLSEDIFRNECEKSCVNRHEVFSYIRDLPSSAETSSSEIKSASISISRAEKQYANPTYDIHIPTSEYKDIKIEDAESDVKAKKLLQNMENLSLEESQVCQEQSASTQECISPEKAVSTNPIFSVHPKASTPYPNRIKKKLNTITCLPEVAENIPTSSYQSNIITSTEDENNFSFKKYLDEYQSNFGTLMHYSTIPQRRVNVTGKNLNKCNLESNVSGNTSASSARRSYPQSPKNQEIEYELSRAFQNTGSVEDKFDSLNERSPSTKKDTPPLRSPRECTSKSRSSVSSERMISPSYLTSQLPIKREENRLDSKASSNKQISLRKNTRHMSPELHEATKLMSKNQECSVTFTPKSILSPKKGKQSASTERSPKRVTFNFPLEVPSTTISLSSKKVLNFSTQISSPELPNVPATSVQSHIPIEESPQIAVSKSENVPESANIQLPKLSESNVQIKEVRGHSKSFISTGRIYENLALPTDVQPERRSLDLFNLPLEALSTTVSRSSDTKQVIGNPLSQQTAVTSTQSHLTRPITIGSSSEYTPRSSTSNTPENIYQNAGLSETQGFFQGECASSHESSLKKQGSDVGKGQESHYYKETESSRMNKNLLGWKTGRSVSVEEFLKSCDRFPRQLNADVESLKVNEATSESSSSSGTHNEALRYQFGLQSNKLRYGSDTQSSNTTLAPRMFPPLSRTQSCSAVRLSESQTPQQINLPVFQNRYEQVEYFLRNYNSGLSEQKVAISTSLPNVQSPNVITHSTTDSTTARRLSFESTGQNPPKVQRNYSLPSLSRRRLHLSPEVSPHSMVTGLQLDIPRPASVSPEVTSHSMVTNVQLDFPRPVSVSERISEESCDQSIVPESERLSDISTERSFPESTHKSAYF